ncbi:MAG: hypothetical protein KAI43_02395 [Candidatus Aureabacteria bacterium]|nr:hypothetical protein [Candidatus Auribacterota bacterium]
MKLYKYFIFLIIILVPCSSLFSTEKNDNKPIKILLIGNSYTLSVAVPFKNIVKQAKKNAIVVDASQGGWSLEQHASNKETLNKLKSNNWDYVTLQEKSTIASRSGYHRMLTSAKKLDSKIKLKGGKTLFLLPWAYRDGDPNFHRDTFYSMLKRVKKNYLVTAKDLKAGIIPVGPAFKKVFETRPDIELLAGDGTHVHVNGGYLAAYVFYAVIFKESPTKIPPGKHSPKDAKFLKRIAHKIVFGKRR